MTWLLLAHFKPTRKFERRMWIRKWRVEGLKPINLVVRVVGLASLLYGPLLVAQAPGVSGSQSTAVQPALANAKRLIDAEEFKQASAALVDIVAAQPKSAAAHEMLAYSYLRLNEPRRSLEEYTRAAAIEQPSATDLQNVAKDYGLLGDMSDAEHWSLSAVKMNDKDPEGWYVLGRIRFTLQRFQEAADCFKRSLVLMPRSVKAENNLGLSYEGLNQTYDAVIAYRQAIAWQQNDPHPSEEPFLNLGIILVNEEQLAEAQKLLQQAGTIAPQDERVHEQLGHLYLKQGMFQKAEEELQAAIALNPRKPALHFLLGRVYRQQHLEAKAQAEFALSSSLSSDRATSEKF